MLVAEDAVGGEGIGIGGVFHGVMFFYGTLGQGEGLRTEGYLREHEKHV